MVGVVVAVVVAVGVAVVVVVGVVVGVVVVVGVGVAVVVVVAVVVAVVVVVVVAVVVAVGVVVVVAVGVAVVVVVVVAVVVAVAVAVVMAIAQQTLFVLPPDVRLLSDVDRTVLEAISRGGPITAREVGGIVYRLRGYRSLLFIRREWLTAAGVDVLRRLERRRIVKRTRGNRWRTVSTAEIGARSDRASAALTANLERS